MLCNSFTVFSGSLLQLRSRIVEEDVYVLVAPNHELITAHCQFRIHEQNQPPITEKADFLHFLFKVLFFQKPMISMSTSIAERDERATKSGPSGQRLPLGEEHAVPKCQSDVGHIMPAVRSFQQPS